MRHICTRCKLTSVDGNLWCQEVDCPAGTLPLLMKYGDKLGKIQILDLLRVLTSSSLYRCEMDGQEYLLKVANPGEENVRYLKHEAEVLKTIQQSQFKHKALPVWVPHGSVNDKDAFGVTTFDQHTVFYILMEAVDGEFLYDYLLDNSQPFHEHVGWFTLSLVEALARIHQAAGKLHLNLTPDTILVVRNNQDLIQPLVIDLGLLLPIPKNSEERLLASEVVKYHSHLQPAYTPPTLIKGGYLSPKDDVYGVGLLLYEMLAGRPAHSYILRKADDIFDDIRRDISIPDVKRPDLPSTGRGTGGADVTPLVAITRKCLNPYNADGYNNLADVRQALLSLYGKVEEKFEFRPIAFFQSSSRLLVIAGTVALVIFVLVMLVMAFAGLNPQVA